MFQPECAKRGCSYYYQDENDAYPRCHFERIADWVKVLLLRWELLWILMGLSAGEVSGIPGVAVKCVEIGRNTSGEGGLLDCN